MILNKEESIEYYKRGDFSYVEDIEKMDLSCRDEVEDVSMLGTLRELCLRGCKNVSDVSALGNLYSLDLAECPGITDVSMLKNLVK